VELDDGASVAEAERQPAPARRRLPPEQRLELFGRDITATVLDVEADAIAEGVVG
jgi:hypothetical protein